MPTRRALLASAVLTPVLAADYAACVRLDDHNGKEPRP